MSSGKKFNVGIIGYGLSAKVFHIPFIKALPETYNLYAIVQRTPKPDDNASKDHPDAKVYSNADDLFADSSVDVVIISSIPSTHFTFTKQALESGKHVVVEKPFVPTSSEASELDRIAKEKGLQLTVYQNRRWDQDFVTLKQLLATGKLGHIAEFETHFDRFNPSVSARQDWKGQTTPASGAVFDLGTHLLDQVYHLFGAPKSVTAFVQVQEPGVKEGEANPDAFTVVLRYGEKGKETLVTAKSSMLSAQEQQLRFLVRGTGGAFKKYHLDVQEPQLLAGGTLADKDFGIEPTSSHGELTTPKEGGGFETKVLPSVKSPTYVEYYRLFGEALKGKGEVPVTAEDAANVLKIIELALESSKTGRTLNW